MQTPVTCRSDYTYAQRPTSIYWEEDWHLISEISGEWNTPEKKVFRVQIENGHIFYLFYSKLGYHWEIEEG